MPTMADKTFKQEALDLIYLAGCAVSGSVPDARRVARMDLQRLFLLAEEQTMAAAAAFALEAAGVRDENFVEARGKALRKAVFLDQDLHALTRRLEDSGIWYMPLKGAVLKDYYPRFGMREMSDYDILYDEQHAEEVKKIMTELGYSVDEYNMHNVDSYEKLPVCRFELHRKLFSPYQDDRLYTYYKDIRRRLIPNEASSFGYHFSNEDFYIYMIAHEYKHHMSGGIGLRYLMDTCVFLRKFGQDLDEAYLRTELTKLGLLDFEHRNRAFASHLFEGAEPDAAEQEALDYMLSSGTFGTVDHAVRNKVESLGGGRRGKLRYIRQRILIPLKTMESAYPFFYRHRLLIPFLYPYRLWKGLFRSRKKIMAEWRTLRRK